MTGTIEVERFLERPGEAPARRDVRLALAQAALERGGRRRRAGPARAACARQRA